MVLSAAHSVSTSNPLVPDYIKTSSRGTATAYVGVSSSLGVFISIKFLFGGLSDVDFKISTKVVGAF